MQKLKLIFSLAKLLILCLIFLIGSINAVVILVPGTFAHQADWWQPSGTFFQALEQHATDHQHSVVPFFWSCSLGIRSRLQAAEILAKLILSYKNTSPIILIGHSHGGNIINLASQIIHEATMGPTLVATEESESFFDTCISLFKNETVYEQINLQEYEKNHRIFFKQAVNRLANSLQRTTKSPTLISAQFIDTVYFLGTPVNEKIYASNMNVIKNVYNLYSKGDAIQSIFGLFNQCFDAQERIINLQVFLEDKEVMYEPGHSQLHDSLIAQHLLDLPNIIPCKKDTEKMPTNREIKFYKEKEPICIAHYSLKTDEE